MVEYVVQLTKDATKISRIITSACAKPASTKGHSANHPDCLMV